MTESGISARAPLEEKARDIDRTRTSERERERETTTETLRHVICMQVYVEVASRIQSHTYADMNTRRNSSASTGREQGFDLSW